MIKKIGNGGKTRGGVRSGRKVHVFETSDDITGNKPHNTSPLYLHQKIETEK